MTEERLRKLVSGAYNAVFDEKRWKPWAEDLAAELGGVGGTFFVIDESRAGVAPMVEALGWAERLVDEYLEGWWATDPQIPLAYSLDESKIYLDTDHVNLDDVDTSNYLAWQRGKGGFDHHMSAVALLGDGRFRAGLSIHRSVTHGHTPETEQKKLLAIFPEIADALRLAFRHNELLQKAFWDGAVVGKPDEIAFLLDENGRIIQHTDAAARMISERVGLSMKGRCLQAHEAAQDAALQAIIRQAIARFAPRSATTRFKLAARAQPLIFRCYPIQRSLRMFAPGEAAALLTIMDPSRPFSPTISLRQVFALTRREAEVCALLMDGHSPEAAAALLGRSMATTRSHMRNIFSKTGTKGQSDLIRLLGALR